MANPLTKMVGPLPVGVWLAVAAGGVGLSVVLSRTGGGSDAPAAATGTPFVPYSILPRQSGIVSYDQSVTGEQPADTNAAWIRRSVPALVGQGYGALDALSALERYVAGEILTADECIMVGKAVAMQLPPERVQPPVCAPPPASSAPVCAPGEILVDGQCVPNPKFLHPDDAPGKQLADGPGTDYSTDGDPFAPAGGASPVSGRPNPTAPTPRSSGATLLRVELPPPSNPATPTATPLPEGEPRPHSLDPAPEPATPTGRPAPAGARS